MSITHGTKVRHRRDRALGLGEVGFVETIAGIEKVWVRWPSKPNTLDPHTAGELEVLLPLVDRLSPNAVGPASFIPFTLRVLGRWFEARHALSGELSNQPFQMLPHQVVVANRVVNSGPDRRNWLIADDVGLGKTIEAGMIMEVLRKRTLGRFRCLIVTPAGLLAQWHEEMEQRFGRRFRCFQGSYTNDLEETDLLIASIDTLRSKRFEDSLAKATPWDLVIFDEAHHLATDTNVLRYRLGKLLRDKELARNMLFLTATPHSGNTEHFWNMLRLLREDLFPAKSDVTRGDGRLNQLMIRNRKSDVTDAKGTRIFQGIEPANIIPCTPTREEVAFYEQLLQFVRKGYGVADRLKKQKNEQGNAVGFLMSTFQKLASSSRSAIRSALQNRLASLEGDEPDGSSDDAATDDRYEGEREEKGVRAGIDFIAQKRGKKKAQSPIENEAAQVRGLLEALDRLPAKDSKLAAFLKNLRALPKDLKVLIFTEYRGTQAAVIEALEGEFGEGAVTSIHGSMSLEERRAHVGQFNESLPHPRFLVSTEAGGEGLNMQKSCHVVMNYDLPWNPVRLQQRIGRVYRYGQKKRVQVYNVRLESESEAFADTRIEAYLRAKIREITARLADVQDGNPEDIEAEVLGQVSLNLSINDLYERAIKSGEADAKAAIDQGSNYIEKHMKEDMLGLFKGLKRFDITEYNKAAAKVGTQHLDFFVRQYLGSQATKIVHREGLMWFDVSPVLREVSARLPKEDAYDARQSIKEKKIERATVDKERAQETLGCRLLRFGDVVFESMVRHVQDSDFSTGVATLALPAATLGWSSGTTGICALFDLKVLRQEGSAGGARVLREELAAFTVARGGAPKRAGEMLQQLHRAESGPVDFDPSEVRRGYEAARAEADRQLREMFNEIIKAYGTKDAIVPQFDDFALAWVSAT